MSIAIYALTAVAGLSVGALVSYAVMMRKNSLLAKANNDLSETNAKLSTNAESLGSLKNTIKEKEETIVNLTKEIGQKEGKANSLETNIDNLKTDIKDLKTELKSISDDKSALEKKATELELTKSTKEEVKEMLDSIKTSMPETFKNLANSSLESSREKFKQDTESAKKGLKNEFSESTMAIKKSIEDLEKIQSKQKGESDAMMNQFKEMCTSMTQALKGNPQQIGQLGEMLAENVLQAAGLRKGIEYSLQHSLKSDQGRTQRPDIILHLPGKTNIVIDVKTPLDSYSKTVSAEGSPEYDQLVKEFLRKIRTHVDDIAQKDYLRASEQGAQTKSTFPSVCMFIPMEQAYMLASNNDPNLLSYAAEKKVIIACAPVLLSITQSVYQIWQNDKANDRSEEIIKLGSNLYNKLCSAWESFAKVQKSMSKVQEDFEIAIKRLGEGNGNAIKLTERLCEYGNPNITKKDLPEPVKQWKQTPMIELSDDHNAEVTTNDDEELVE